METLLALWRGKPQIEQPHDTTSEESPASARANGSDKTAKSSSSDAKSQTDRSVTSPPPSIVTQAGDDASDANSPQTTPKARAASASSPTSSGPVPSLSLSSPQPPASAAAVARATGAAAPPAVPSLSAAPVPSAPAGAPSALMPPPPRPPRLNGVNNSSSMLSPGPSRGGGGLAPPNSLASAARQPGTSTLAPPPTHSTKPAKPSRKVILEPGHSPLDWARLANSPTSDLRNLPPGTPYLKVTPSMLKKMTGRRGKDAWTALGGRVYNLTPYLPFHPGGEPELMRCAGRDGTKLFGEIHPWVNYEGMLATSLIGMMVEEGEESGNGKMDEMD
ncbi:hypothetical protein KJ359_006531 [Pestalotiopsis sp. 9143b]|nr:hypothetical protein KJ359_006531 [Pestalotiopsis sp. 9143b]